MHWGIKSSYMEAGFRNSTTRLTKATQHESSALAGCWFTSNPHNPLRKAASSRIGKGADWDEFTGRSRWSFRPPTPPLHNRVILWDGETGLTEGRKLKQHKVSKCQNIDIEMITLASLMSTSQMLENSVPNSSVLVTQHTAVQIQIIELAICRERETRLRVARACRRSRSKDSNALKRTNHKW